MACSRHLLSGRFPGTDRPAAYTAHKTGNAFAVALLLLAGDFVPSLFSPVTGVLSDRLDRRALMVACELIRGGVIGTIAILQPALLALLILVGLQSVVAGAFQPASRAAVPHLVGDRDLAHANATIGFGTHGLEVIGPALAAIALPLLGLRGVLFVDAATFVLSAALLWRLPSLRAGAKRERVDPLFAAAREGLIAIWNRPAVRAVAVAFFLVCAFTAIDDVALVFLARDLKAGDAAISLLYAGAGSGLMIGLFVHALGFAGAGSGADRGWIRPQQHWQPDDGIGLGGARRFSDADRASVSA